MHKDLKDLERPERSETLMAALRQNDERLDPSTRVLTVLARISERGCRRTLSLSRSLLPQKTSKIYARASRS